MIAWLLLLFAVPGPPHEGLHEELAALTNQIAETPRDARLYLRRAELHRLHAAWPPALEDLREAQRLAPALVEVELVRGRVLLATGELEQAEAALDRLLRARARSVQGLLVRADVREQRGAFEGAARDYDRALELDEHPGPGPYLGRARVVAATGAHARALAGLDEGIDRFGPIVTLQLAALELELDLRRYDAALQRIDVAAAEAPRKETWLARRGDVLALAGRDDDARVAWRSALEAIASLPRKHRDTRAVIDLQVTLRARLSARKLEETP